MYAARSVFLLAVAIITLATTTPSSALDVTLDSGAGSLTIVDNDVNDLDIAVGTVEFDVTVGGKLDARARVREEVSLINRIVNISAISPDTHATFRNVGVAAATFTITVNSSSYASTGPPLGCTVFYTGDADDPTPDDVEITDHSVECITQPGAMSLATVAGTDISPPVPPGMQPVLIDPLAERGSDGDGSATATRVVFTFTAGPGDEIRIPDSQLYEGTGLEVWVYNEAHRCIDQMNNRARKVAGKSGKAAERCVKTQSKLGGGPSTQCTINLTDLKIDDAEDRLLDGFDELCNPPPPWGVNGATCCEGGGNDGAACTMDSPDCDVGGTCRPGACISGAAERAMRDLGLDIFGGTALIGVDDIGNCQRNVIKRAGKVLETRWKIFRKCKKNGVTTIPDDATLIATCLGPPQVDDSFKIASTESKVASTVDSRCVSDGVVPVGSAFPGGLCSDELDTNFATCVNKRIACRFCIAVNVADDIVPALDCDAFDDGVTNSSCP
jgi:hypothetical protein